jgi:fructuronate reductase
MLAIAAWMAYVSGLDEKGQMIEVKDPLADDLKASAEAVDPVAAFLSLRQVFPAELAGNATFKAALHEARSLLADKGAKGAVAILAG